MKYPIHYMQTNKSLYRIALLSCVIWCAIVFINQSASIHNGINILLKKEGLAYIPDSKKIHTNCSLDNRLDYVKVKKSDGFILDNFYLCASFYKTSYNENSALDRLSLDQKEKALETISKFEKLRTIVFRHHLLEVRTEFKGQETTEKPEQLTIVDEVNQAYQQYMESVRSDLGSTILELLFTISIGAFLIFGTFLAGSYVALSLSKYRRIRLRGTLESELDFKGLR